MKLTINIHEMKKNLLFSLSLLLSVGLHSQVSQVQFINNSPDYKADTVDIYVNNAKIANDVEFRSSTAFLNINNGTVNVDITDFKAGSNNNPIYSQNLTLTGGTYIAILEGLLSLGYSPPRSMAPFEIHLEGNAKTSGTAGNVEMIFHQGSTDLRPMDVLEIPGKTSVLQDMAFGNVSGYFNKTANDTKFQIRESSSQFIAGEFQIPLSSANFSGNAVTIMTSGFIDPVVNNYGSNFGLFASLPSGGPLVQLLEVPPSQARVQFIHNSADASIASVDIWANNTLLYNNLDYLYCRAFEDFPSDTNIMISITHANSIDTNNAILRKSVNLSGYKTHIFVLEGINSNAGYNPGRSSHPLKLHHITTAAEVSIFPNNTDLGFHNGCTDLNIIDFYNSTVPSFLVVENISYQGTSGYIPFSTQNFDLQMRGKRQGRIIAQFRLPLNNLNFQDSAGLVVTSGFLDPAQNSNGNDMGLYYAPPGGGPLLEFLKVTITSTLVQFLHNSPDQSMDTVDIYIDERKVLNDFPYLHSSPFMAIYADSTQTVSIAPSNSVDTTTAFYKRDINFDVLTSRYLIIEGMKDPGYNPPQPLYLREYSGARIFSNRQNNIDVLFYNGSSDVGIIDIHETTIPYWGIANDLDFSEVSPFRQLAGGNYVLNVSDGAGNFIAQYDAPFKSYGLEDKGIVVLASGFIDPSQNNNGNPFGLYVSLPTGGKFIKLPELIGVGMSETVKKKTGIKIYPNPSQGELSINTNLNETTKVTLQIFDSNGKLVYRENYQANQGSGNRKLNLEQLMDGLYLLQLKSENGINEKQMLQIIK